MSRSHANAVKDQTTSTGPTAFVVAGVAPSGFNTCTVGLTDGATYAMRIDSSDRSQWVVGDFTWTASTATLTLVTPLVGSSGVGASVTFSAGTQTVAHLATAEDFGASALELVTIANASGAANVAFTGLLSGYDYELRVTELVPASLTSSFRLLMQVSEDNGATWKTAGSNYLIGASDIGGRTGISVRGPGSATSTTFGVGQGQLWLGNLNAAGKYKTWIGQSASAYDNAASPQAVVDYDYDTYIGATNAINAIRFVLSDGTTTTNISGQFRLYRQRRV